MPLTIEGDFLIILAVYIAVSLPIEWPRPFAKRRAAHMARVKARAVAAERARQQQARVDAALARAYAYAEYEMSLEREQRAAQFAADYDTRITRIETAPESADLEEFYVNI